ncbi:adenosylhomocysteinase [Streptomyces europaeiscabiei]|uniref:adenosylhomocysteinase n=1 Tax=Streptomyces europaeiscabiei TaxID=146819 RepID=UPI0029B40A24|nr:adenosylhomocysteinase [Streptomyces europaeiscabiei]MDX3630371.1 adenosylhomocysteinase [Streptomyces europaeiscabiei]MDX3648508.1 adenosylhomocysteinase [Streptomyces europaeiscabiei]
MSQFSPAHFPIPHDGTRWAARHMPMLAATMRTHAAAFAGRRIGICLHIEPKTAVLVGYLAQAGAEIVLTGSPGTTQEDTADALRDYGVTVVGHRSDDLAQHRDNVARVLDAQPDLILDNGADLIEGVLARGGLPGLVGATEETTTGGLRIRSWDAQPDFPVVVINDSRLKLLVENEFGVGQSVVQGFMNATNLMIPGTHATVVGYGPCGRGVADTLAHLGARVSVADTDPYRALEAVMAGHQVGELVDLLPRTRFLFLATGHPGVIGAAELGALRDGAIVAGVGHMPWELNANVLAEHTASVHRSGPSGQERAVHRLHDGREIVILADTKMINLTAARGNPIEAMDLGLTLQARSLAAIAAGHDSSLASGVQAVPAPVDRQIATDLVATLSRI